MVLKTPLNYKMDFLETNVVIYFELPNGSRPSSYVKLIKRRQYCLPILANFH